MLRRSLVLASLALILMMTGCSSAGTVEASSNPTNQSSPPGGQTTQKAGIHLTVFAAASLTGAFEEIGGEFEAAHPGVQVSFNFAGSQILRTQLEQGAAADVFASADQKNMDLLKGEQLLASASMTNFATNSLVVILPRSNPGKLSSLADLARPGVKIVLADESVPAGNYARQVLLKMSQDPQFSEDFNRRVLANVVSNETDVKQVVAKVELGEADAGIVYISDSVAASGLLEIAIPEQLNVVASYPIAILAGAHQPKLASMFIAYVTTPAGQSILAKWGFGPAGH